MSEPTPQQRAADAVSRLGQEHPTEQMPSAAEQAITKVLYEIGAIDRRKPAESKWVSAPLSIVLDKIALELGRDALQDGLAVFLDRLVGPQNAARLLAPIRAEALRDVAANLAVHVYTAPQHNAPGVDAVVATDLEARADELERGDTDAR